MLAFNAHANTDRSSIDGSSYIMNALQHSPLPSYLDNTLIHGHKEEVIDHNAKDREDRGRPKNSGSRGEY